MIISDQSGLEQICQTLAQKPYITVDTEFLRDKTYYSRLCLIQLSAPDFEAVAIDPLAKDIDLTPFYALMQNEAVLKVFHACRQDIEIFYQQSGKIPTPLFDTQVAAMVCGYGDQIAYAKLVQDVTGKSLAKNAQFTDWSRRPLAAKQLTYALDDVIYLRNIYESLSARLEKKKRTDWVKQEMAVLTNPETYELNPHDAWERVKIRTHKPKALAVLRELAAWRENLARKKNIPKGRIARDDAIADIAVYMPKDKDGLFNIRSLPKDIAKSHTGDIMLKIVASAMQSDKSTWPIVEEKKPFPKEAVPTLEMLKLLLKINASEQDVAAKLIATNQQLEDIALGKNEGNPVLKGWRYEIFGKEALALTEGTLYLGIKEGKITKYVP